MNDTPFQASAIEQWPAARLVPYAANARLHDDHQVALLADSLRTYGWLVPCLVAEDGTLIAGHGRLLAAIKLGIETVPVIRVTHLSPEQVRAFRLLDNKVTELGGWSDELLAVELKDLGEEGLALESLGFGEDEIDRLLEGLDDGSGPSAEEDEVGERPADPITRPGDVWLLGEHRLLCGDATVLADVERVLGGGLADMTFTDPPYNVDYGNSAKDKLRGKNRKVLNDNLGDGFQQFLYDACVNVLAVTKGAVYVCMSSSELHTLQHAFKDAGGHWSTFVIWAKNTFTLGRADYQRQYEPILYGWKEGTDHYWCGARDQGDVWFVDKPARNDLHPTMKPVALVERAIRNSSKTRDVVLDPFGGAGSTLIAAERSGRQARLIELDPAYCDVIVERWQNLTGGQAVLGENGRQFERVTTSRSA